MVNDVEKHLDTANDDVLESQTATLHSTSPAKDSETTVDPFLVTWEEGDLDNPYVCRVARFLER